MSHINPSSIKGFTMSCGHHVGKKSALEMVQMAHNDNICRPPDPCMLGISAFHFQVRKAVEINNKGDSLA